MMLSSRVAGGSLGDLLAGLVERERISTPELIIGGLVIDSRKTQPGDVFLAMAGGHVHGLAHVGEAVQRGAVAVIYEPSSTVAAPELPIPSVAVAGLAKQAGVIAARFYGNPCGDMLTVGVTGTNGKTSCTHLLAQMLNFSGVRCGLLGTLGYGLLESLTPASHTTPNAIRVQAELAQMRDRGARAVAMEVSSHALEQWRVEAVQFKGAIFTNLTRDHLDYHPDMEAYFRAKQRLFARPELEFVVVNGRDARAADILSVAPKSCRRIVYGVEPSAGLLVDDWLVARRVDCSEAGLEIWLAGSWGEQVVKAPLLGDFNADNVLAVLAVLLHCGYSPVALATALAKVQPVPGRMARYGGGDRPLVVVDYAHTPDALDKALRACRRHTSGRLWCVFGCGGDRDRGKRPQMGAIAGALADQIIVTDDNPRSEMPQVIVQEIQAGFTKEANVAVIHNRATAIDRAISQARLGDVVLVAGKGHEEYQIVGDQILPFSDARQVQQSLMEHWV